MRRAACDAAPPDCQHDDAALPPAVIEHAAQLRFAPDLIYIALRGRR